MTRPPANLEVLGRRLFICKYSRKLLFLKSLFATNLWIGVSLSKEIHFKSLYGSLMVALGRDWAAEVTRCWGSNSVLKLILYFYEQKFLLMLQYFQASLIIICNVNNTSPFSIFLYNISLSEMQGINQQSQIGFLTLLENLRYCEVSNCLVHLKFKAVFLKALKQQVFYHCLEAEISHCSWKSI